MDKRFYQLKSFLVFSLLLLTMQQAANAQRGKLHWSNDGSHFYLQTPRGVIEQDALDTGKKTFLLTREMLTPPGKKPIAVASFTLSTDGQKVLIFTNTKRVWRYNTRGDYWVYDTKAQTLKQIGVARPASSLMFAKLSPDGTKAGYVSEHNLYIEDLASGDVKQLTFDGSKKLINGTFDWAYEEEFDCRDGFRWSPDSKSIAYWQIDASKIKNYLMLNTTDSIYPYVVPVEYPVAGEDPSSCKIGVVDVGSAKTTWLNIPGDPIQHYIPRMEWADNSDEVIVEQLNRAQNQSRIYIANVAKGDANMVREETSDAWIDGKSRWNGGDPVGWEWLDKGKAFLWMSEKDGWEHLYKIDRNGKETLITKGNYDVIDIDLIDNAGGYVYFIASPDNATPFL